MSLRTGFLAFCVVLAAGCARDPAPGAGVAAEAFAAKTAPAASPIQAAPIARAERIARLADRGELVAYPGHAQREDGAYTWHRADISEAHALEAMADGHLRLTAPDGRLLDVRYDDHVEHPSGDWTWIGHLPDDPSAQTLITFGEHAVFGSIAQPGGKPALRLTMRDGVTWLVETDPAKVAGIVNAATRPTRPDYHIVRKADLDQGGAGQPRALGAPIVSASAATATAIGTSTVDLLVGYTAGLVTSYGSTSAVMTRLNYLVDVANAALSNSKVTAKVRLVHAMQVSYTDTNTNDKALEELSGYHSDTDPNKSGWVTTNAAFNALRSARETYGADLVSLVRPFRDPEQDSCGLAWLLGGAKQGIQAGQGWDRLAYSVVGDGSDRNEQDGKTYFCRDESLAHEMGHNEGSAHDRKTSQGTDGVLNDPDDYGAFQYSFGYKTSSTAGNFYTVMAYGDTGQTSYRVFSNPRITFCGGRACGTTTYEDNARSLSQTIPVVAGFRATSVPMGGSAKGDYNADGASDVLWRNQASGANSLWLSANSHNGQAVTAVGNLAWQVVGHGDLDGDGAADIVWRNRSTGQDLLWRSAKSSAQTVLGTVTDQAWTVVGVGDFDGDGHDDLLWRNGRTGANALWRSANVNTDVALGAAPLAWHVQGVGDFNGDGHADIFWRNIGSGANAIWLSGNANTTSTLATVSDTRWSVVGVGDFDGDGHDDLLWRNSATGANSIWLAGSMNRSVTLSAVTNTAWAVKGTGDYDGDGRADILWRNSATGADVIWLGASSARSVTLTTVADSNWTIVG